MKVPLDNLRSEYLVCLVPGKSNTQSKINSNQIDTDAAAAGAAAGAAAAAASAAAIVFTTTNVVVASMAAAEAAAAATPAAAASLYQSFQVDTKGLKLNGGHFVHDNFKHLAPNPDA